MNGNFQFRVKSGRGGKTRCREVPAAATRRAVPISEGDTMVAMASAEIERHWSTVPEVVLVLGTGMGPLARQIFAEVTIPYHELPGFAPTTALSHRGCLVCGTLSHTPLLVFNGRCHFYEGYCVRDIVFPIQVARARGASTLIVTNACGGLNPDFVPGTIMVIEDHLNLMGRKLMGGQTYPRQPRPACTPYDSWLIERALRVAGRDRFSIHRGVYAGVTGPNYETRAEYSFLRRMGADAVGMSTVAEVELAARLGMRILGLSIVTNVARAYSPKTVDARHVVNAAQEAEPRVREIVSGVIQSLAADP
ncbi:MAG: purine-nucleoside phosphorylase [Planctomycetota bacterium]